MTIPDYDAHVTDTTTGETRVYRMGLAWNEASEFWWSDGNFGCDCNRALVFGHFTQDPDTVTCGDERYRVRCVAPDGTLLYEDDA